MLTGLSALSALRYIITSNRSWNSIKRATTAWRAARRRHSCAQSQSPLLLYFYRLLERTLMEHGARVTASRAARRIAVSIRCLCVRKHPARIAPVVGNLKHGERRPSGMVARGPQMNTWTKVFWSELEELGEAQVRARLAKGFYFDAERKSAFGWLQQKEAARAALREVAQAEQIARAATAADRASEAAARSARAAEEPDKRAAIALIISVLSLVAHLFK